MAKAGAAASGEDGYDAGCDADDDCAVDFDDSDYDAAVDCDEDADENAAADDAAGADGVSPVPMSQRGAEEWRAVCANWSRAD